MNKYHDFKNREICFLDSEKKGYAIRGYKADYEIQIDDIPNHERDLKSKKYNYYCSICQYEPMPWFNPYNNATKNKAFKEWVSIRNLTISKIDFFIDFDGKDLKNTFQDVLNTRQHLLTLIGEQSIYLNCYFSGNKGFHLLGKMGETFGKTPQAKLNKNYEIAMQLKLLCPTIDETIYDLARVRKLIGSKVHSPKYGQTRVVSCDTQQDYDTIQTLLDTKNQELWTNWQTMPIKRLNKIETTQTIGL